MGQKVKLQSKDGFTFSAYQAKPNGQPKGGVVVIQEIFGVNEHIRDVVDGYAVDGYFAIAPQIFDRAAPDIELGYEGEDMQRGMSLAFKELDRSLILQDIQAAVNAAVLHGKVGIVGYCFGGLLTWLAAAELEHIAAASAYYGGGMDAEATRQPRCPIILHFGEQDTLIPPSSVEIIRKAHPEVPIFMYTADHGFNCNLRGSFDANSAAEAKQRTLAFFGEYLV